MFNGLSLVISKKKNHPLVLYLVRYTCLTSDYITSEPVFVYNRLETAAALPDVLYVVRYFNR